MMDTYSEAWRHECEAQYVAAKPSRADRAEYLDAITKRRGTAAGDKLRASVARIWAERRAAKPHSPAEGARAALPATRNSAAHPPGVGSFPACCVAGNSNPLDPLGYGLRA